MKGIYPAYSALTGVFFLSVSPFWWIYARTTGRYGAHLGERLGVVPTGVCRGLSGVPRIWVHAVSLGEVKVAASVIPAIRNRLPGCAVVLSTATPHGRDLARKIFGESLPVVYSPVDVILCVRSALNSLRPHVMAFLETEIWPSWFHEARRMGIPVAVINGRISHRSFRGYRKFGWFFRDVLRNVDAFSMISEGDAARIAAMGADPRKISISGNAKYDTLAAQTRTGTEEEVRRFLGIESGRPVLVAGSIREGEEAMVLEGFSRVLGQVPDAVLVMAPRHIQRSPRIRSMAEKRGMQCRLRTEGAVGPGRPASVILLDSFGELFNTYSIAAVAVCGGSLVPLGGQNPLEPAAWGKPVLYGPHMDNFADAKGLLDGTGGGLEIRSASDLAEQVVRLLRDPHSRSHMGERARMAVMNHHGASEKHAEAVARLWEEGRRSTRSE